MWFERGEPPGVALGVESFIRVSASMVARLCCEEIVVADYRHGRWTSDALRANPSTDS